ncbi:PREDICTED: vesicle-associated membrane protein 8 isoform X1 [Mandrillus leucophaeus]|uniref:vesicle-associated membrane protein 8 isoform X1 n=1 Tax=Mandrillus leucophaeus TaxID=9568 RepID=UPI0005F46644|nr:PREDICTED: vesicle-associated membrane protein 8 isoform X1 [Mandrillus leucophaeus]
MEEASEGGGNDRVRNLQSEVEGVKNIMTQNVERILARGENLEHLRNKTEDLEATRMLLGPPTPLPEALLPCCMPQRVTWSPRRREKRELDCGCISWVLRVGWRDLEGPACGWETAGGQWVIKTFQYPYMCESLSLFPFCLWLFYFFSSQGYLLAEILSFEVQVV